MLEVLQLLRQQMEQVPKYCGTYYVRTLMKDELLPPFNHGLVECNLVQRDWIWVAYNRYTDAPVAMLAAAPGHGIALLLRISATKSAPKSVWLGLFRKALADMNDRGYNRWVTFLAPDREQEAALLSIAAREGGKQEGGSHLMVTGPTECHL